MAGPAQSNVAREFVRGSQSLEDSVVFRPPLSRVEGGPTSVSGLGVDPRVTRRTLFHFHPLARFTRHVIVADGSLAALFPCWQRDERLREIA